MESTEDNAKCWSTFYHNWACNRHHFEHLGLVARFIRSVKIRKVFQRSLVFLSPCWLVFYKFHAWGWVCQFYVYFLSIYLCSYWFLPKNLVFNFFQKSIFHLWKKSMYFELFSKKCYLRCFDFLFILFCLVFKMPCHTVWLVLFICFCICFLVFFWV